MATFVLLISIASVLMLGARVIRSLRDRRVSAKARFSPDRVRDDRC